MRFDISDTGEWRHWLHDLLTTEESVPKQMDTHSSNFTLALKRRFIFNGAEKLSVDIDIDIYESDTDAYIGGYTTAPYERILMALLTMFVFGTWLAHKQNKYKDNMNKELTGN